MFSLIFFDFFFSAIVCREYVLEMKNTVMIEEHEYFTFSMSRINDKEKIHTLKRKKNPD